MVDKLDKAVEFHREQNNKNLDIRYLGDGSGNGDPRLKDGSGRMWVRINTFSSPVALPLDTNANIPPRDNLRVEVGYINGKQCILRAYREGMIQSGLTPGVTNPSDTQVKEDDQKPYLNQFRCKRSVDPAKPFYVVVESGYLENSGVSEIFFEAEIDLSSFVPSAGASCIACVYLKTDNTLEAFASTPVTSVDPIQATDIDACRQQATVGSMSIWGWRLDGDASKLSDDTSKNICLLPIYMRPDLFTVTDGTTTVTPVDSIAFNGTHFTVTNLTGGAVQVDSTGGGGGGAPTTATYITQTPDGTLSAEQALSALASGIMKSTTGTGVVTTVAAPSGAVVGDTDTQTLTNKTITGAVISGGSIDNTPIGATTANTLIASAMSLLIGGFKAIFTHANTANRTYTFQDSSDTIVGRATTDTLTNKTLTSPTINTPTISGGTADNMPIGTTTRALGYFSALREYIGGFAAIFTHANSADRTYTLPNFNGTLATLAGTETFSNKTINSPTINTPTITNGTADNLSIGTATPSNGYFSALRLKIGGFFAFFTHANTANRTVTFPDYDITVASISGTETLLNKTLTSPAINSPTISGGTADNIPIGTTTRALGYFSALREYIGGFAAIFTHGNTADRTYNLPDATTTIVGTDTTQTLTNKTIGVSQLSGQVSAAKGGTALDTSASTGIPKIVSGVWSVISAITAALGGTGIDTSGSTGIPKIVAGTWSVISSITAALGGTGIDTSASTGVPSIVSGVWSVLAKLTLALGGTGSDLSATGGTSNYVKQSSTGANLTVGTIADADLPTALAGHTITGGSINNTPIGATTASTLIASAFSLLIGGFKAIFTHANTADRTYTLPDYNGTVATLAGTETFTNKTLTSPTINTPVVSGGTIDNTPIGTTTRALGYFSALREYIGGFAAIFTHANTADRTYTLPDATTTIVGIDTTQTLTNKTIGVAQLSGQVAASKGGTGQDLSASTGTMVVSSGTVSANTETGTGNSVRATSPTIVTPTVASFANANHNHTNSAGGGQITDAALSAAVSISKGGTGQTAKTAAFDALSPTGSKGDLVVYNGSNNVALAAGANYTHPVADSGASSGLKYVANSVAIVENQQTSGTAGGTSVSTTWTTLVINTELSDADGIVTISSNKFTPVAGVFRIHAESPFRSNSAATNSARIRLRNVTTSTVLVVSSNFFLSISSVSAGITAMLDFIITANGTDEYDIQYYVISGLASGGLGSPVSETSAVEHYTRVVLERLG